MKPVDFEGQTHVLAKDQPQYQPQYQPLPVHVTDDGVVTSCWKLSWFDRLNALLTGRVYVCQLTFWNALQPQLLSVARPGHVL